MQQTKPKSEASTQGQLQHSSKGGHAPKLLNQPSRTKDSQGSFFKLSQNNYAKLNNNYSLPNCGTGQQTRKNIYATADVHFSDRAVNKQFVRKAVHEHLSRKSAGAQSRPGQEKTAVLSHNSARGGDAQSRGSTAAGTNHGGASGAVRRVSRNHAATQEGNRMSLSPTATQQQQLAQLGIVDPRFAMYSRDAIRDHLDRRRARRAQSTTGRPRQRFSTITGGQIDQGRQSSPGGRDGTFANRKTSAISQWSSNMDPKTQLEIRNLSRCYPTPTIGSGPAYSIPSQAYPGRLSPTKADMTPRMDTNRAASSRSPNQHPLSQRTLSANSGELEVTPGCTDYSPNYKSNLKKEPGYAVQNAIRWNTAKFKVESAGRPHVYEDPNKRTFRRSNSGSFNRAARFKSPIDSGAIKAYLLQLRERKTQPAGSTNQLHSNVSKFNVSPGRDNTEMNTVDPNDPNIVAARSKARPQTEGGRARNRRSTIEPSTTDLTGMTESQLVVDNKSPQREDTSTPNQQNNKFIVKTRNKSAMYTPRFSLKSRGQSVSMPMSHMSQTMDISGASPGPASYETRVDSCIRAPCRQHTIQTAKRFMEPRPAASPEAGFYDTRPKLRLLLRTAPTVRIAEAKRDINPHNFHAKNAKAFLKGIALKAFF